jgi:phosphoglycerate dehydrogenase-like enzyme
MWRRRQVLDGRRDSSTALLACGEILVCRLPLTAETEGVLNTRSFALLPKGASGLMPPLFRSNLIKYHYYNYIFG